MEKIPNYKKYKELLNWWIDGGISKLGETKSQLYRLISKYGKQYNELYCILPKSFIPSTDYLNLDLISTSPKKLNLKANDSNNYYKIIIKNSLGICINEFDFTMGNMYKNEVITFGNFKITKRTHNSIYVELEHKTNQYSDLLNRLEYVNNYSENISKLSKKVLFSVENLKNKLDELT